MTRNGLDMRGLVGGFPRTEAAVAYAEEAHAGQRRGGDGSPFILHPLEVASLLRDAGAPDHVIAAGVLHDVVEKAGADPSDVHRRFGHDVARLVLAVSEDKRIRGYSRRKDALRRQAAGAGDEAMMVFAADKISKVRELQVEMARGATAEPSHPMSRDRRLAHYRSCLAVLQAHLAGSPLVRQLDAELQRLSAVALPA
jgi:(p)ppGpp synthase/HD superfamily hydrolase